MKKLTLFTTLIIATVAGFAQPAVKLYGYSQTQLPGMVTKGSKGNGAKTDIAIYFQWPSKNKVTPTALWVNGKSQDFTQQPVELPVVRANNINPGNPVRTVLVPANGMTSVLLMNLKSHTKATPAAARKLIGNNAVVIEYLWKGKKYYKSLKTLVALEPVSGE